jgi:hypothetical protein
MSGVEFEIHVDVGAYEGAAWVALEERLMALLDGMRACPGGETCDCPALD